MALHAILPMDLLFFPSDTTKDNLRWAVESGITKNSVKKTVRKSVAEILSDERSEEFIESNRFEKVFSCFVVAGEVFFGTFLLPEQKKVH